MNSQLFSYAINKGFTILEFVGHEAVTQIATTFEHRKLIEYSFVLHCFALWPAEIIFLSVFAH